MAFALTSFFSRSVAIASPSAKRGIQQVVINATGLVSDVDLDIGDASGTFWTAAKANTTYGTLATNALTTLQKISGISLALVDVSSAQLLDRVQVATPAAAGDYALAIGSIGPNISFFAGDGETSYKIILTYELKDTQFPIVSSYGTDS